MNVRRRSPRFTNTGEASASTLNSNELEVIQPAVTRSLAAPRPLFDTQANESRAVLRSPLTSLGGEILGTDLKTYVITAPRQDTQSNLEIRQVQAVIYHISYYGSRINSHYLTANAIATENSPISNLSAEFSVHNVSAVHFKLPSVNIPRGVTFSFQARHTQYFTQGQYEIYLLADGEARTLVATIDSHPGHNYVSDVWSTFSVTLPKPVAGYHLKTFTLEFVRTL